MPQKKLETRKLVPKQNSDDLDFHLGKPGGSAYADGVRLAESLVAAFRER